MTPKSPSIIPMPRSGAKAVPALGYTQTEDVLLHDLDKLSEREFRRTALNQRVPGMGTTVIPAELWERVQTFSLSPLQEDNDGAILPLGQVVALDTIGDGWTSIAVADRRGVVELVEYVESPRQVEALLIRLLTRLVVPCGGAVPVAVLKNSPMDDMVTRLAERWERTVVPLATVKPMAFVAYALACSRLFVDIVRGSPRIVSSPMLNMTLGRAWRKELRQGGFVWQRHDKTCDISPLAAITLAYDAAVRAAEEPPAPEPGTVQVAVIDDDDPRVDYYRSLWDSSEG